MPQFMIDKELGPGKAVDVEGADAHHITDVLRLGAGDWIVLTDGMGGRFSAVIKGIAKRRVTAIIRERLPEIKNTNIMLCIALIKHDRLELIIQKAVELGTTSIVPFASDRTIPKYSDGASAKKLERWNKIALEAAKQSGLPFRPEVKSVSAFSEIIENSSEFKNKILFYEGEKNITIDQYFKTRTPEHQNTGTLIVIGPEGGFSGKEVSLARENGFSTVGLGPLIMRVDTAALAATTLTQYFLGHFNTVKRKT